MFETLPSNVAVPSCQPAHHVWCVAPVSSLGPMWPFRQDPLFGAGNGFTWKPPGREGNGLIPPAEAMCGIEVRGIKARSFGKAFCLSQAPDMVMLLLNRDRHDNA